MKFAPTVILITPSTHSWKGSEDGKLKKCFQCGAATSGIVKEIATGKKQPLCSRCAGNKGF